MSRGDGIFLGNEVKEDGTGGGIARIYELVLFSIYKSGDNDLFLLFVGIPLALVWRVDFYSKIEEIGASAVFNGCHAVFDVVDDDAEALGVAIDGVVTATGEEGYEEAGQEQSLHEGTFSVCLRRPSRPGRLRGRRGGR